MDVFGPLSTARSGASFILVCIDHFSRWVEMTALARVIDDQVAKFLRAVWIPHHDVPRLILSENGPQFISEVLRNLSELLGVRKIYTAAYHPQGNSICESRMRTLKKALGARPREDGGYWDVHLQAAALAHNSKPHTSANYNPFFLVHERDAGRPIQGHLDTPRLDAPSRGWLDRLWRSRLHIYKGHMAEARCRKELIARPGAKLPAATIVAVKLTPADLQDLSQKLAPRYSGPWVTLRTFDNRVTYSVVNPESKEVRQVPISQMEVLERGDVPDTTTGEQLLRWVAPWTGEPSLSLLQAATQASRANGPWMQALSFGEQGNGAQWC